MLTFHCWGPEFVFRSSHLEFEVGTLGSGAGFSRIYPISPLPHFHYTIFSIHASCMSFTCSGDGASGMVNQNHCQSVTSFHPGPGAGSKQDQAIYLLLASKGKATL